MDKFISLKYILNYYNKDVSLNTLTRKGDSFEAFVSIANENGFRVKRVVDKSFKSFPPFIVETTRGFYVVVEIKDEKAYIYDTKGQIEDAIKLEDLKKIYISSILVKPRLNANKTLNSLVYRIDPKKWLFDIIKVNMKIYKKVFLLAILINLLALISPMYMRIIYDRVLPNNAKETLIVFSVGIIFVYIFDFILKNIRTLFVEKAAKKFDLIISQNIFDQLMQIKLHQKPKSTGIFVNSILSFASLREFFTSSVILVFIDLPFSLLFVFVIFSLVSSAGWVVVATALLLLLVAFIFFPIIKNSSEESFNEDRIKHGILVESIYGLEIIRAINATKRMFLKYNENMKKSTISHQKHTYYTYLLHEINSFIIQVGSVILIFVSIYLFFEHDKGVTPGGIFAAMILYRMAVGAFSKLSIMIGKLTTIYMSFKSAQNLFSMQREVERENQIISKESFEGNIEFKNVTFSYEEQNRAVLENINLSIKKGEKVAILGHIGSGKSTLSKLLLNLYQPQEGTILIDGININQIEPLDLRANIGYVPQDIMLFNGTLKENITLGATYFIENEKILNTIKAVGLEEIVSNSEKGLDLVIGERGDTLSGGEKQALCIARAIVNYPPILILDEATKSMDSQSERMIIKSLKNIIQDKTTIIITHKPSMLELVDRIVVLNRGKVVLDEPKEIALQKLGMRGK